MAITYANTTEMENIARELSSLTQDLDSVVDSLYTRLNNVPTGSKEWVGKQSDFYFDKISADKQTLLNFSNQIRALSDQIGSGAEEIRSCLNKNHNGEA